MPDKVETRKPRWFKHLVALAIKRFIYTKRSPWQLCFKFLVPVILVGMAFYGSTFLPQNPQKYNKIEEMEPWRYIPVKGDEDPTERLRSFVYTHKTGGEDQDIYMDELMSRHGKQAPHTH